MKIKLFPIVIVLEVLIALFIILVALSHADVHMSGLQPVAVNQGSAPYCAEAAASEALFSTGWAFQATAQDTFSWLSTTIQSSTWPSLAIQTYMTYFYPDVKLSDVLDRGPSTTAEIKDDIDKGEAVNASWFSGTLGHALSVWGYDDNGFWVTNSWGSSALFEISPLGFYSTGDLREVVGLIPESMYVPSPDPVPMPVLPEPDRHTVPEPQVWALLLMGLVVMGVEVKRTRKP